MKQPSDDVWNLAPGMNAIYKTRNPRATGTCHIRSFVLGKHPLKQIPEKNLEFCSQPLLILYELGVIRAHFKLFWLSPIRFT